MTGSEPQGRPMRLPGGYERSTEPRPLPWSFVRERLEREATIWLATTGPEGRPHVAPVWFLAVETVVYFTGIPTARWARNLSTNPAAVMHLESGTEVVILDGEVKDLPRITDPAVAEAIVSGWRRKYGRLVPDPANDGMYALRVATVRAWHDFPHDLTRWVLG